MMLRLALPLLALAALLALGSLPTRSAAQSTPAGTPRPTVAITSQPVPTATPLPLAYAFPIQGPGVTYGPGHHTYPATDIFGPSGNAFVAVTHGVVDFVSYTDRWEPATNRPADRGGLSVAIVGDDGVRYYGSHLSGIAPGIMRGVRVQAGQLLGWTGSSGNARPTPPHVHFGISRPTYPEDWAVRRGEVWPYEYLQAWQRGEVRTPQLPD